MGSALDRLMPLAHVAYYVQRAALATFQNDSDDVDTACERGRRQLADTIDDNGELVRPFDHFALRSRCTSVLLHRRLRTSLHCSARVRS